MYPLWQANKKAQAKICYIKALLIAPSEIPSLPIKDEEIAYLLKSEGPCMTLIHVWLQYGMPYIDLPTIHGEDLEHFGALNIYYKIITEQLTIFLKPSSSMRIIWMLIIKEDKRSSS